MKSASEFFRAANGARVRKTVTGVLTADAWPEWISATVSNLKAQGATEGKDFTVDDKGLQMADGRFVLKPKLRAEQTGTLLVRSADYGFTADGTDTPVWGDRKGATVDGSALVKTYPNGMVVRFELI